MSNTAKDTGSFLGTGWAFPPEFVKAGDIGTAMMTTGEEDILGSLAILFGTALGERFLQPTYGLDMHDLLFESASTTMKTYLEDRIRTTILVYEPRINLVGLTVDTTRGLEGKLQILIEYVVRTTNSRYNLVFPFAVTDGNEIRALPVQGR
jgi:phage baseplate assembly protein W